MKKGVCFFFCLSMVAVQFFSGCNKEVRDYDMNMVEHGRINRFIVEGTHTYYLWESETDWKQVENNATYVAYTDHDQLFERLRYKDDVWSALTNDIGGLERQVEGVSTTFGYTLSFQHNPYASDNEVIAVVLYTAQDSPAANAGIKRGDIIIELNGAKITRDNYRGLYNLPSLHLRCGLQDKEAETFIPVPETKTLVAVEMYENPINAFKIIEKEGKKIGYLCYTSYQQKSESELLLLFAHFKAEGVQEVVLDLRYNTGGFARTSLILSSILAPASAVKNQDIYLQHYYNKLLTSSLKDDELSERFLNTLPVNMNLSRLYVLTSERTASAAEATMVGLEPYLTLIHIGETTSGKYCGGILLSPEDLYNKKYQDYYMSFSSWGMYIMIYRFANIKGISSFTGGLVPGIRAAEVVSDLKPFGDEDDPLLGRAIAHIVGEEYVEKRTAKNCVPFIVLPDLNKPIEGLLIAEPPVLMPFIIP